MSESHDLKEALNFIAAGQNEKALTLLWKLHSSKSSEIKLNATINLMNIIDGVSENKKRLALTEEAMQLASAMGSKGTLVYLLSRKADFLLVELSALAYRRGNLKLAARSFHWIDFSLEKDKKEYEAILKKKEKLEKEISSLEHDVLAAIQSSKDHYLRGRIFMSLGEMTFQRFLFYQLDLASAGRLKSKFMNMLIVKRWHLNILIGFDREAQRKIRKEYKKSINYFEKSIKEFKINNLESELPYALYGLATKYTLTYRFSKARRYLEQSRILAERENEGGLLLQINELEKRIKDKYKHPRDYVEELGLDLPQGVRYDKKRSQ